MNGPPDEPETFEDVYNAPTTDWGSAYDVDLPDDTQPVGDDD